MNNEAWYELIRGLTRIFAALLLIKYSVFLLAAPFHRVKEAIRTLRITKHKEMYYYNPLVSVLVPAWNEEIGIVSTIQSILDNDYNKIEVVIVNDGSTDSTELQVKSFLRANRSKYSKIGRNWRYLSKQNGGKGVALNHAIESARGEIIITIDADSIADKHMVKNIVHYFRDPEVDAVVGNVKVAGQISFLNLLQRLEYLFGFYHKRAHSALGAEYIYGGACAAFRKSTVFDEIGVFDTSSITEDIEMSLRTRAAGHQAVYADNALCYTEGANSIVGLIKQRLRWKKGRFEAFQKHRRLFLSTNVRHNKWLAWFILPFALLAEFQLLFEPIGLTLLFIYSVTTGDYSSILLGFLFVFIMYVVVGLLTERAKNWWIVPLAPFTWAIFYFLVWVEYVALLKSLSALIKSETVAWQKWQRKGITVSAPKAKARS